MTWREKISKECPDCINPTLPCGMNGCPDDIDDMCPNVGDKSISCTECWDREVPEKYLIQENNESADKKREGSVESETTADVIADMYHRLIDRGFPSGTAEIIVYKMIDHGYFDKK